MKILVTGANGQIGWELLRAFPADYDVVGADRSHLDLTDPKSIQTTIESHHPDVIVNAAGYTAVDRAEDEPELAMTVNGNSVGIIGDVAKRVGSAVVHLSTDYVFDGTKNTPYTPEDPPNPINNYGRSKLAGEQALINSGASHIIIRTAWIYGLRRRNFLMAILRQAGMGKPLKVVNDQVGCPTWSRHIAQATAQVIDRAIAGEPGKQSFGEQAGIYHFASRDCTTWYDFAKKVFELIPGMPKPSIMPVSTEQFGARAKRPAYSVLDCSEIENTFGVTISSWDQSLSQVIASDSNALARATTASAGDVR